MTTPNLTIELPWPPASLSGQNTGHWHAKAGLIAKHREWAKSATLAVRGQIPIGIHMNEDIRVSATFYPPDRRGDRVRYPQRIQAYWDGIADALKVNDRRFLPTYHFAEPVSNPRVAIVIGAA